MAHVLREDRAAMDESVRKPMTFLAVIFIFAALYLGYDRVMAARTFESDFGAGKELGHVTFKGEAANLVYKVQPGDTWWTVARDHEVSTRALLESNDANIGTPLTPGQNIHLPGAVKAAAPAASARQP